MSFPIAGSVGLSVGILATKLLTRSSGITSADAESGSWQSISSRFTNGVSGTTSSHANAWFPRPSAAPDSSTISIADEASPPSSCFVFFMLRWSKSRSSEDPLARERFRFHQAAIHQISITCLRPYSLVMDLNIIINCIILNGLIWYLLEITILHIWRIRIFVLFVCF